MRERRRVGVPFLLGAAALAGPLAAIVPPPDSDLRERAYRHPDLHVADRYVKASDPAIAGSPEAQRLTALGLAAERAFLDLRTSRWGTLMPAEPLLPGDGTGNELTWDGLAEAPPRDLGGLRQAAWDAFVAYLRRNAAALRIDIAELASPGRVTVHDGGRLIQIYAPRVVGGVPVRDCFLIATVRHGNLILLGARNWGDVSVSPQPAIGAGDAKTAVRRHLGGIAVASWRKSYRTYLPMADGEGLRYRLAWAVQPVFQDSAGHWEALVDAHRGELLAFEDRTQYAAPREVEGGVYPISNDGDGPEGMEQPRFPMPFADLENQGELFFTDGEGNLLELLDGTVTTTLSGRFVRMNDSCGEILESTAGQFLDLGTSAGTDCDVPPGGSPGNTHASRSGFYEINRIKAMARDLLPENPWLRERLDVNVNLPQSCGASWNGFSINLFTSGGACANTGELAGVYDHEWGHGMDDHDANPTISNPSEGVADAYAYLRLGTSCIGPGFLPTDCNGYGDPCTDCTGVRDIDWAKRASGMPHDVAWIDANCGSGQSAPCGGTHHCEGAVTSEALFDLVNRDLPALGFDHDAALQIGSRLHFLGGGLVGNWYQCLVPFGGCNGDGGYLNYLAADDDNGDFGDGTPHMSAIFAAFDRHGIACDVPAVADSACRFEPASAPILEAVPRDREVVLVWSEVVGAGSYQVLRTDGVRGCDFGKSLAGETAAGVTELVDQGLKNGHEYHYTVVPVGSDDACLGPASPCVTVAPAAGPHAVCVPGGVELLSGPADGDVCLDNGEQARVFFEVQNVGSGALTDLEVAVVPASHPGMAVLTPQPLVFTSVPEGGRRSARVDFQAFGLAAGDALDFRVDYSASELGLEVRSHVVPVPVLAECDFDFAASRTFTFEAGLEGWRVEGGTFERSTDLGGGDGSAAAVASSEGLAGQCDQVRSPALILSPASTLGLWTNLEIEPMSGDSWYDRANVGIVGPDGERVPVAPDGGRLYNADGDGPGSFTGCNDPEEGWAGDQSTWAASTWSAAALGSAALAGEVVHLDVVYATDAAVSGRGVSFDEVTVTDVRVEGPDAQPDVPAGPLGQVFADGFESGDPSAWQ